MRYYAFLVSLLLAVSTHAQTSTLTVWVGTEHDEPAKMVHLILNPGSRHATTDSSGVAYFKDIPFGSYRLLIQEKDYKRVEKSIVIGSLRYDIRINLSPLIRQLDAVEIKTSSQKSRKSNDARNIEVVDQQFIQRHLGGSLSQTLARQPGLDLIGIGSGQSKPLIRGLGFNRLVVVDKGVKHEGQQWGADHGLEIDQFATGEIEIIKGPSSFIYGSDAIGGAINLKPVIRPLEEGVNGATSLIGKSNNSHYGISTNLYGRKNKWFFDSRITYQNYADYKVPTDTVFVYDYAVKLNARQLRNTAGRESGLHFNFGYANDRLVSNFYVSNTYSKSGFFANAHGLEPRRVDETLHDRSARDLLLPLQRVNHFKVINQTSFTQERGKTEIEIGFQRNFRQEFNHYVNHGYMPPVYPAQMTIPINLERQYDKLIYSINIRQQLTFKKHQLLFGTNTAFQANDIDGWSFLIPAFTQANTGLFVYDKFAVSSNLMLHGALRFDYGNIKFERYDDWFSSESTTGTPTAAANLTRAHQFSRSFKSLVWSTGINYNPGKFSAKANFGKSFRMPIAKELAANGVNYHYFSYEKGDADLAPEIAYQLDLGLSWNDQKWGVTLSPFYNYFPNYIYLNPTSDHDYYYGAGNQVFEYTQSRVMRYGAELKINYDWLPQLKSEVLGEYLYSEQLSGAKSGFTLPFSPPPSLLLNLSWHPKFQSKHTQAYISVDYKISSAQDRIVPPERKTAGYQVVNMQLGAHFLINNYPFQLNMQVQNLFDTAYLMHTSFYRLISLPEAGRNLVISLKIPFKKNNN